MVEDGRFQLSESSQEYRRALELNPNYATAHQWYGFLMMTDKHEEALSEMDRARQLDPLSLIINTNESRLLCGAHQPDQAIGLLRNSISLDPNFAEALRAFGNCLCSKGPER